MKKDSWDKVIIFVVYLLLLLCLTFFSSCSKEEIPLPADVIEMRIPLEPREKVDWESSHYWILREGDTIATITKTYLNYYTGQWTVVTLPPLVSNINALVPTINPVCYNSEDGSINTIIAPLYNMKGDTLIVTAKLRNVTKIAKIVLD